MTQYKVVQRPRDVDGGFYVYDVYFGEKKVAEFGHSHRGDEPMLRLPGGEWESFDDILVDDEPPPYRVSLRGAQSLNKALTRGR